MAYAPQYTKINQSTASSRDPKLRGEYGGGGQPKGTPGFVSDSFERAGNTLGAGTQMAEGDIRQAYEDLFRHRAGGIISGFGERQLREGAEGAAQGLSSDLVKKGLFSSEARTTADIGAARADAMSQLGLDMASLHKGSSVEMANLMREEGSVALENYMQYKARKAARDASKKRLLGSALGLATQVGLGVATGGASLAAPGIGGDGGGGGGGSYNFPDTFVGAQNYQGSPYDY